MKIPPLPRSSGTFASLEPLILLATVGFLVAEKWKTEFHTPCHLGPWLIFSSLIFCSVFFFMINRRRWTMSFSLGTCVGHQLLTIFRILFCNNFFNNEFYFHYINFFSVIEKSNQQLNTLCKIVILYIL